MSSPISFSVDYGAARRPLHHPWRWCVGSGHAPLALRADWQQHLAQAHRDLGFRYVRFHGLLCDDMGTLIVQSDALLYSFFNTDRIFDFLLSIGMRPIVELSFMPRALSSGGDIVFHYQGNITPPKDQAQWGELVRRLLSHWIDRYGIEEVSKWPIECWNEPNLAAFWTGSQADYFDLYRTTAAAVKSVDSRLRIGGPVSAENAWLEEFTSFCEKENVAHDFISTHYYPTDAFGTAGADTRSQLEHSPPGIMRDKALEARAAAGTLPLYYTEWSISSNPRDPLHDVSFAAALAVRIVLGVDDVVDGYSYWTFSDIFEENYFPSVPFHGGFGLANLYGVPKPVYRAFEMLRTLGDEQVEVAGAHATVAMWAGLGQREEEAASLVLINQAMPRHAIDRERVVVRIQAPSGKSIDAVRWSRIDEEHANPERAWRAMGSPEYLKPAQVDALLDASRVETEPVAFCRIADTTEVSLVLAPQSVNKLQVLWQDRT